MREIAVHSSLLAAAAAAFILVPPADAATRDSRTGITVSKVAVEAGRLVIEGTTPRAGQTVGLVSPKAAVRSSRTGKSIRRFRISVPSTPTNCRAVLTLGAKVSAPLLITGCAVGGGGRSSRT
jgi:hypothetical protein